MAKLLQHPPYLSDWLVRMPGRAFIIAEVDPATIQTRQLSLTKELEEEVVQMEQELAQ